MTKRRSIPALVTRQWMPDWNDMKWKPDEHRDEPPHHFYQFSLSAPELRALSGVHRRTQDRESVAADLGIQRRHEAGRSREIARFVRSGYPWSILTEAKRKSSDFHDLRQPGWLPTAIVVNIRTPDQGLDGDLAPTDLVEVRNSPDESRTAEVLLPVGFDGSEWRPESTPPIEVIDGQHRLWAFATEDTEDDFELPVVAFHGLALSWRAYLFYTINIKPKRINPSLAFDLYPLLRTERWLEHSEPYPTYREHRAQEIVDILWAHPMSPWHHRINMLAEPGYGGRQVTQAAWVRSLSASFLKNWEGRGVRIGGLFGARSDGQGTVLPWPRLHQAALLVLAGREMRDAVHGCREPWADALRDREAEDGGGKGDAAFVGKDNLLNQDQGLRALLQAVNDLLFVRASDLALRRLFLEEGESDEDGATVTRFVEFLQRQPHLRDFLGQVARRLATYDWRSSKAPGLTDRQRELKAGFRGSGGYRDVRAHVLSHLASDSSESVSEAAREVISALGYRP